MNRTADENALRDLVNRMPVVFSESRHTDAEGFRNLFYEIYTTDCDYITFAGDYLQGVEANIVAHEALNRLKIFRGAVLEAHVRQISFLSDDVGLIHSEGGIRFRWQNSLPKSRRSIQTIIAVREEGRWKVRAFQNTRIKGLRWWQKLFVK